MADLEQNLHAWLSRVSSAEVPPSSVVAYNVGLFETEGGYSAYLAGAGSYSAEESDLACGEVFSPAERYLAISADGLSGWEQVHTAVVGAVRAFLESPEGERSFLFKAEAVTVGFDDGDLERVR